MRTGERLSRGSRFRPSYLNGHFPYIIATMPSAADLNDLRLLLARAFDLAWARYYVPGRSDVVSEDVARVSLAKHLIATAKAGTQEEGILAEAGFRHLVSLTSNAHRSGTLLSKDRGSEPQQQLEIVSENLLALGFRIDGVRARFLLQWRVPWSQS